MPHKHVKQLNWGAERRNAFIEFRVFWHGRINRSDLMETFGISLQQASLDLSGYSDKWKRNLVYDKSQRAYVRGKNFTPHFSTPSAEDYFAQLRAVDQGLVSREQSWIGAFPGYGATPTPARGVAPETLRDVLAAIHEPAALQVNYQSMSRPEPSARWIEPHALAFDGFRWHARAFCQNDQVFKDFLLSRIVEIGKRGPVTSDPQQDDAWHSEAVLEIGPHPDLSPTQRRAIEMDYGMEEGRAKIPVRRALLFYALKRLGLDTDPAARQPQDQQILLLNRYDILGPIEPAGEK
ncbi:WYL domain-containing protein [Pararhizobium antarcticum]|uniref:Transcriptional regulator n=1 Tax=Pararhizobium antarcticum TaxID=1798805 RepID=A0A657LNY8_9HYPH|nr:WYL domain-containing protein [Pararhizobium antarcticum]OJF92626.1 transcriptional regulator [Pararhizobium antarcticum]